MAIRASRASTLFVSRCRRILKCRPVHSHPDERVRVITSGTYYSALGDKVDPSKLLSFPPGTFSHVPPKVWQLAETRDEEVIFENTGIDYLKPEDDPRKQK